MIALDLRGPSPEADCLDCLVALPLAIERMRAAATDPEIANSMIIRTREAFLALDSRGGEGAYVVARSAQDLLSQHIAALTVMDGYTRYYFDTVAQRFFARLSERNVRTFYVLDNALRDDRFSGVLALFGLAGFATTTPRRDGKEWSALAERIRQQVESVGHVAYIEPDAEVNYIEEAQALALELNCVAPFRNLAPEDGRIQVLSYPRK